jgi:DNA mismatch repair protein MutL
VHPTKAEVRFRDRAAVEDLVERGVRGALETLESAATFGAGTVPTLLRVRERRPAGTPAEPQMALFLAGGVQRPSDTEKETGAVEPGADVGAMPEASGADAGESPRLWQVHDAWILAEVRDGLLLIDQHAAHERVLFERIMAGFSADGMEGQRLLFPLTVRLTLAEYAIVEELGGLLRRTGFEVEGFGGDTVIVHAVPHPHPHFDAERCLREMIDELARGSELTRAARNQHERVAMSFACKGAIKAGQPLSDSEVQELFDALFATELPFHDVHGRPTTVRLSRGEIERKFGR